MPLPKCLSPKHNDSPWSRPLDVRDLAVRLETEGVSDAVAQQDYGFADTWEMAEAHFAQLVEHRPVRSLQVVEIGNVRRPILDYLNGVLFALPLFISCIAILLLRYSLWGSQLPAAEASALGLAVVSSFIASGGFVQVITRQGLWYLGTKQFRSCVKSTFMWFKVAIFILLLLGVIGIAAGVYLELMPAKLCPVAAAFYFSLCLLWLSTGLLYMLQKSLMVALAVLLGIGLVVLLNGVFGVPLLAAQITAILIASVSGIIFAGYLLRQLAQGDPTSPRRESIGKILYYVTPYFAYGCLYYLFLFSDRLLAWTARTELSGMPIQFRGAYEAAQDMALFAFIIQVGWVHWATARFYKYLKTCQEELGMREFEEFNRRLRACYWKIGRQFVPICIGASIAGFLWAWFTGALNDALHIKVMIWSLVGYMFLVPSLRNVSLLFALSRPGYVLLATTCACGVNIVLGYLLSRFVGYEEAIAGFAFGALAFAGLSTVYSLRVLNRLDYHYLTSGG
jgi:hypothetical protein